MTAWPELFVLRHGQTEWNAAGRQQGRLDSPLTDLGRAQARQQGLLLRDQGLAQRQVSAFVSPQGRASLTAAIALAEIGRVAVTDDRLVEIGFGDWEGLTKAEIAAGWPDTGTPGDDPFGWHFRAPGGETLTSMRDRVAGFLDVCTGPAIVVTHGITSRVLRGLWLGLDAGGMAALPGGQGVVYHLADGTHRCIAPPDPAGAQAH